MLNSGLGFSDEFEMEACSYSAKSSSKFMQQYKEWTYTMRKESSAFFRSVKDKACYINISIRLDSIVQFIFNICYLLFITKEKIIFVLLSLIAGQSSSKICC